MSNLRLIITQEQFDAWANGVKMRWVLVFAGTMVLLVAACTFAIAVMGPRLVREGALLWFGTRAEGTVRQIGIEEDGKFKGGAPKYRLRIDYAFSDESGARIEGSTTRTDVRNPPDLGPGDPIGVYYAPSNPANSVAEHNLRIDVYALALFLPFLGAMGIMWPLLWAWRFWRWHRGLRLAG